MKNYNQEEINKYFSIFCIGFYLGIFLCLALILIVLHI